MKILSEKGTYLDLTIYLNLMSNKQFDVKFLARNLYDFSVPAIGYDKGLIWPASQGTDTLPTPESGHSQSLEGGQSITQTSCANHVLIHSYIPNPGAFFRGLFIWSLWLRPFWTCLQRSPYGASGGTLNTYLHSDSILGSHLPFPVSVHGESGTGWVRGLMLSPV